MPDHQLTRVVDGRKIIEFVNVERRLKRAVKRDKNLSPRQYRKMRRRKLQQVAQGVIL